MSKIPEVLILLLSNTFVFGPLIKRSLFSRKKRQEEEGEKKLLTYFICLIHGIINGKNRQIILSNDLAYKRLEWALWRNRHPDPSHDLITWQIATEHLLVKMFCCYYMKMNFAVCLKERRKVSYSASCYFLCLPRWTCCVDTGRASLKPPIGRRACSPSGMPSGSTHG